MKYCQQCGMENPDRARFCVKCGAEFSDYTAEELEAMAEKTEAEAREEVRAAEDRDIQRVRAIMGVRKDETIITSIGNSYLRSLLAGGIVEKTIAIVTKQRLYYHGKLYGSGRGFSRTVQDGSVPLKDITYTGTKQTRGFDRFIFLGVLIALNLVLCILAAIKPGSDPVVFQAAAFITFRLSIPVFIGWLVYHFTAGPRRGKSAFVVSFAGGELQFEVKLYTEEECAEFRIALNEAIDNAKQV